MSYMYNGVAKLPTKLQKAISLFDVVNYCQVQRLQEILSSYFVQHFLNKHPFSCFPTGLLYGDSNVKNQSETFIKLRLCDPTSNITETDDFYQMILQGVESLLSMDSFLLDEISAFKMIMNWVAFEAEVRVKHLNRSILLIRFFDFCTGNLQYNLKKRRH